MKWDGSGTRLPSHIGFMARGRDTRRGAAPGEPSHCMRSAEQICASPLTTRSTLLAALVLGISAILLASCTASGKVNPNAGAPPPADVIHENTNGLFTVEHPEQFPLAAADAIDAAPELNATGVVSADVSRNVPVVSLASGRVVDVEARLGDQVSKGQLLMRVQSSDIAAAFSDYRHATADETLARAQLDRAQLLFDRGAMAQKDLEVARGTEEKAKVDVETARERLRVLGADINNPSPVVNIYAPVSGVITEQNVTNAAGVKTLDNSPNLFTISDLSQVWILCDVYENDLKDVRVGEFADVRLNAYPGRVFQGRIANIGAVLDPNLRTAKVRLELRNPGVMRLGMFVTATFHSEKKQLLAVVPASAILHLHDRDWVYVPVQGTHFQRLEVVAGKMTPEGGQEIESGLKPGDPVVRHALVLQNTVEQ